MPAAYAAVKPTLQPHELLNIATDPTLWAILGSLGQDKSAKQVAEDLGMKQANAQYHLKQLVKAGLVDEFPLPEYQSRYVYSRRTLIGSICIDAAGTHASARLT